jgi:CspA family cold shock protein
MVECEKCGGEFLYGVEEQRSQEEMGFEAEPPQRCPSCREEVEPEPGLRPGVVKWYSDEKAYGFIMQQNGSDIFFHRTGVQGDVSLVTPEGTPVWYQMKQTDKGPQAYDVHKRE